MYVYVCMCRQVKEFSLAFDAPQLGLSLVQSSRPGDTSTPAIVGQVRVYIDCILRKNKFLLDNINVRMGFGLFITYVLCMIVCAMLV